MNRIVGIIPARMKSARLPGKPLKLIGDRPMIQWVYEAASAAGVCSQVLVATDSPEICQAVEEFGGQAVMTSPDHPTGTDRLVEVAKNIEADIFLNLQGDEPFISPETIKALALEMDARPEIHMGTVAVPVSYEEANDPNNVKVVLDKNGNALYFSRALIPFPRNISGDYRYLKHLGIYAYRREFLLLYPGLPKSPLEQIESLEQLRALYNGYRIKVLITEEDSLGVDTPDDLAKARKIAQTLEKGF